MLRCGLVFVCLIYALCPAAHFVFCIVLVCVLYCVVVEVVLRMCLVCHIVLLLRVWLVSLYLVLRLL